MRTQRHRGVRHNVTRSWWALVLGAIAIVSAPLMGHHSFAVYYIEADTIEVEGEVIEFQYKNPHSWIFVAGQDPFGKSRIYGAEWGSTSALERNGITKLTLRAGDNVHIWGSPSRDPNDNRIRLRRIERRSDGWRWGQNGRETR